MIVPVLLGVLVGILSSGSGLGGGFLVVPFLLHMGKEARVAVGTSFIFVLMVAASSLVGHSRVGNVDWKIGAFLALGGVFGAQAGPFILEHVSDQNFKRFFAVLLIGTGLWFLYQSRS
ncbi:MAG: sulfite exporter TauE/SafE family protein [Nitrospinae bacterium]|nr:sulfite exporter TauE/SafE family protein [Nitrospinota bacterium]